MKLTPKQLKRLIQEAVYQAKAPDGRTYEVEADSTKEAGDLAADHFGGGIDPYSIDVTEVEPEEDENAAPADWNADDYGWDGTYEEWLEAVEDDDLLESDEYADAENIIYSVLDDAGKEANRQLKKYLAHNPHAKKHVKKALETIADMDRDDLGDRMGRYLDGAGKDLAWNDFD